jgi:uncharacterized membrane protein
LLTTLVLVLLRVSATRSGMPGIHEVEVVITVVYAAVLVLSAPVNIILSRFASDRVYEQRAQQIAAPLRRTLAVTMVAFAFAGAGIVSVLDVPLLLATGGVALTVVVGGQWLMLSAAGGLSTPGVILKAFAWGAPASLIAAVALSRFDSVGPAGYLYGFWFGQVVTLALLLWGTFRALPDDEDEDAAIGPAFSKYWLLGLAALLLQGGIWIDKLVVYLLHGGGYASAYAALAALAWLTVVPTCGSLFLQVETGFYDSFRAFYDGVERGAPLDELDRASARIDADARRVLLSTGALQLAVTLIALAAADRVTGTLWLDNGEPWTARILLIGATLQVISLCATLLLHYFDFQWEALVAAAVLIAANASLTSALDGVLPSGSGYAIACGLSGVTAIALLRLRLGTLVRDTYQAQPYGSE